MTHTKEGKGTRLYNCVAQVPLHFVLVAEHCKEEIEGGHGMYQDAEDMQCIHGGLYHGTSCIHICTHGFLKGTPFV